GRLRLQDVRRLQAEEPVRQEVHGNRAHHLRHRPDGARGADLPQGQSRRSHPEPAGVRGRGLTSAFHRRRRSPSREAALEFAPKHPVPVFPLPDFVLFPQAVVPLHVFEMRYRALVRDTLRSDRLIAMALLAPGWEHDYHGSPAFHPIGCLARIERVAWQPDDCYDLWLTGLSRCRFSGVTREYPYREARIALLPQEPLTEDDPLVQLERRALDEAYRRTGRAIRSPGAGPGTWVVGDGSNLSFEGFVNAVCGDLALSPAMKLEMLSIDSLLERS